MPKTSSMFRGALLSAVLFGLLPSCAHHAWMMVPPKMDLLQYERIGLVEFQCSDPALKAQVTREFQELLLEARPGSRLVLVPPSDASGGELAADGVRSLAEKHDLDALFTGTLEFTDTKPSIGLSSSLVELSTRSEIVGTMSARLVEPSSGATVWARSADERATVAGGSINSRGEGSFGASDPNDVRQSLVHSLAATVTHDFRAQYYKKRVEDIPPGYRVTYPDGVEVYVPPESTDAR